MSYLKSGLAEGYWKLSCVCHSEVGLRLKVYDRWQAVIRLWVQTSLNLTVQGTNTWNTPDLAPDVHKFAIFVTDIPLVCCMIFDFPARWTNCRLPVFFGGEAQVRFNSKYWLHCHSNVIVYRTKSESLRWQVGEDIHFITFEKYVTSLVKKYLR